MKKWKFAILCTLMRLFECTSVRKQLFAYVFSFRSYVFVKFVNINKTSKNFGHTWQLGGLGIILITFSPLDRNIRKLYEMCSTQTRLARGTGMRWIYLTPVLPWALKVAHQCDSRWKVRFSLGVGLAECDFHPLVLVRSGCNQHGWKVQRTGYNWVKVSWLPIP